MQVLQSMQGIKTLPTSVLTAEECRRNFSLGKRLFTAFLISKALSAQQIKDFHIFLTFILSLEKSIRANFIFTQELIGLTLLALTRVEEVLEDFESPISQLFKDDLMNLKFTLEHYLKE